ncbi:hypothetical protein ACE01N_09260 [Saccharicrinis sp. FJH2]|uniref:hypothetical protein n=1 Tax=Saccharicrinis sp. FJH65 TaxID=3344659 RepID=UPI0035F34325
MKDKFALIISIIFIGIFSSCESNKPELKDNWIQLKYFTNNLASEGKTLEADTLIASVNDEFLLSIYTQIQPRFELCILKNINNSEFIEITDLPGEATLTGYYEENGIRRKINTIQIRLNESIFNPEDEIIYLIRIESASEMIEKNLIIKIK